MTSAPRIAIIGAGVAGLACGQVLQAAGLSPVLFEKSRGLGGRMATRWTADGLFFDHGAQYVTTRSRDFSAYIQKARQTEDVAVWKRDSNQGSRSDRYVGIPGMKDLARPLAQDLDVRLGTRVIGMQHTNGRWSVETNSGATQIYDYIVCAMPAPQTLDLLPQGSALAKLLAEVDLAPCWALMVAFNEILQSSYDWQRFDTGPIAWVACNSAKPKRPHLPESWVIHASPSWSTTHLEDNPNDVQANLLKAFGQIIAHPLPPVFYATAHRWRYALTTKPLGQSHLSSDDNTLLICGDWCLGARIEEAFHSGRATGEALSDTIQNQAS